MAITSPNMGLRIWNQNSDRYDHDQLADNWAKVDFHDHSPGRGQPIPTEAFLDGSITSAKLANTATVKAVGGFRSYRNAALSTDSDVDIVFDTETFDQSGWYDTGNGRYTPGVAGYYALSGIVTAGSILTADKYFRLAIYKNGSNVSLSPRFFQRGATAIAASIYDILPANGTTDYFTIRLQHDVGSSTALSVTAGTTRFQGHIVGRS